VKDKR